MTVTEMPKPPANPASNAATETPKSRRGRKPGQEIVKRPDIPMEMLNFKELDTKEKAEARRKREPRSEQQRAIDDIILELWEKYVAAGKPKNWVDMPVFTWGPLPVQFEDTALLYIRRACSLYGRRQRLGDRTYEEKAGLKVVYIPFSVEERTARVRSSSSDDN
jgi:hypothetical protein